MCERSVDWCSETTDKIRFDTTATTEQIETFLAKVEAECGVTPTDDQPKGYTVFVHREFVDIEID